MLKEDSFTWGTPGMIPSWSWLWHLSYCNQPYSTHWTDVNTCFCGQGWLADELNLLITWPDYQEAPGCTRKQPEYAVASHHLQLSGRELRASQLPPSILTNSPRSTAQLQCFLWPKASPNRIIGPERGKTYDHHPSHSRVPDFQTPLALGGTVFHSVTWSAAYSLRGSGSPLCFSFAPNTHVMTQSWEYKQNVRPLQHSPIYSRERMLLPFQRLIPHWEGGKAPWELSSDAALISLEI